MSDTSINKVPAGGGRRSFITRLACAAIAPTAAGVLGGLPGQVRQGFQLEKFAPLLGTEFQVAATESQPALTLILHKAEALRRHAPGVCESFSLRFKSPLAQPLQGRIYDLRHPVLGSLALFITPVGTASPEDGLLRAEAIINQAPPAALQPSQLSSLTPRHA